VAFVLRIRETGSTPFPSTETLEEAIGSAVFGAHHGGGPHVEVIDTEQESSEGLVCTVVGDDAGVVTVTFSEEV
jgi:hypothetical protein